jgi:hypothetical protein
MAAEERAERNPAVSFAWRFSGALRLGGAAFADVELDRHAMGQAISMVVIAGLARGVGAFEAEGWVGLFGGAVVALAVWLCAGVLIWSVGVRHFGYDANLPELLRTIGFAAAPLVFLALCAAPLEGLEVWVQLGAHTWASLALVVAVREALDVSWNRALVVCALTLALTLGLLFVVSFLFVAGLA